MLDPEVLLLQHVHYLFHSQRSVHGVEATGNSCDKAVIASLEQHVVLGYGGYKATDTRLPLVF